MAVDDPLVSTAWLAERLDEPSLSIIDATWFMPGVGRDAGAEFLARHIPGARFFDLESVRDHKSPWPHMLASPEDFTAWARSAGATEGGVVVYDTHGLFSAARLWWNFRAMGAADVFVLDGGLPAWIAEKRLVEAGHPPSASGDFTARLDSQWVRSIAQMRENLASRSEQVVDARPALRFFGEEPEPRPGLRPGHMPGAANLPWDRVLDAKGRMRSPARLAELFTEVGIAPERPVVATCGSGVTAAILALALARLGAARSPVYDGSWAEWGALADTPVAIGRQ